MTRPPRRRPAPAIVALPGRRERDPAEAQALADLITGIRETLEAEYGLEPGEVVIVVIGRE